MALKYIVTEDEIESTILSFKDLECETCRNKIYERCNLNKPRCENYRPI